MYVCTYVCMYVCVPMKLHQHADHTGKRAIGISRVWDWVSTGTTASLDYCLLCLPQALYPVIFVWHKHLAGGRSRNCHLSGWQVARALAAVIFACTALNPAPRTTGWLLLSTHSTQFSPHMYCHSLWQRGKTKSPEDQAPTTTGHKPTHKR